MILSNARAVIDRAFEEKVFIYLGKHGLSTEREVMQGKNLVNCRGFANNIRRMKKMYPETKGATWIVKRWVVTRAGVHAEKVAYKLEKKLVDKSRIGNDVEGGGGSSAEEGMPRSYVRGLFILTCKLPSREDWEKGVTTDEWRPEMA